jgi:hypothetical protein
MNEQINLDFLSELCAQLERAWQDRQDRSLVYELSSQFPQYSEYLHEFFEDLVLGPDVAPNKKISEAEDRVAEWLSASAFDIVVAAAASAPSTTTTQQTRSAQALESRPQHDEKEKDENTSARGTASTSWQVFLRQRTKQKLPDLVRGLSNVTTEYLVLVSRHPSLVPLSVKARLAQEVERTWGVPVNESFSYLAHEPELRRAASRTRPFEREPETFEELLDRANLSKEQKAIWLRLASSRT